MSVNFALSSFCKHRVKAWTCCLTGTQAINLLAQTSLGACSPGLCRVTYACPRRGSGISLLISPGQRLRLETRAEGQGLGVVGEGRENENGYVSKAW